MLGSAARELNTLNDAVGSIVNFFFFVGGIVSTIAFMEKRKKRIDKARNDKISAAAEEAVERALSTSLVATVDGAIDKSLDETLEPVVARAVEATVRSKLGEMDAKMTFITDKLRDNGGSSVTDALKRLENGQSQLILSVAEQGSALSSQQAAILGIVARQDRDGRKLDKISSDLSGHLGEHKAMERL